MRKSGSKIVVVVLIILVLLGIRRRFQQAAPGTGAGNGNPPASGVNPARPGSPDAAPLRMLTDQGGRVAWYTGDGKDGLIAFDAIVSNWNKNTEVFTMDPDGSGRKCVTCNSAIPKGFVGQPDWWRDGDLLVVQAENANSTHGLYNHQAWGINEDLWVVRKDGSGAEKIWSSPKNNGALHPHFSRDGTKLIFAERIATGKSLPALAKQTPGGENPWDGWQIHIADFDPTKSGEAKLSNHRVIKPNGSGFYETHAVSRDGRKIIFSFTPNGKPYVDDTYTANLDGTGVQNLIESPSTWDEHGNFSPDGTRLAFISSRVNPSWAAPASNVTTLRTEIFIKNMQTGAITQLTHRNENGSPSKRYLTSDFDWDATGKRIVFQVAPVDAKSGTADSPEIWITNVP